MWPPSLDAAHSELLLRDLTGRSFGTFAGTARTVSRPGGQLLNLTLQLRALTGLKRALVQDFLASLRGGVHRAWCHDHSYTRRGSFPTAELMGNNTFANGVTGWTGGGQLTRTVTDRQLRATRTAATIIQSLVQATPDPTVTPFAAYVLRFHAAGGQYDGSELSASMRNTASLVTVGTSTTSDDFGLLIAAGVPHDSTVTVWAHDITVGQVVPGDFVDFDYASLTRCAMVDNGANLLLQSDELDTGDWSLINCSVDDNATTNYHGSGSADSVIENTTASAGHHVQQNVTVAAAEADYSFTVALKAGSRGWARLAIIASASSVNAFFDLTTGALGSVSVSGANWANARATIGALGDGWWQCSVVGRKVSADTTLTARIGLATGNTVDIYTGNGTGNIYAYRATLAPSSVPTRLILTTTAAKTGTAETGAGVYVTGLPVSSAGLLLKGDQVQIGSELFFVTGSLNSDAAGIGYLMLHRPPREAPANGAPVIIERPMGLFMLANAETGWSSKPGGIVTRAISAATVELIEAPPT